MKPRRLALALVAAVAVLGIGVWRHSPGPVATTTMLSLRVGQHFQEVVKGSTYPVLEHSSNLAEEPDMEGDISVSEPAVSLCFNDPQHGFVLPPTKFAFIGFDHDVVVTISTSPMLDKLSFDQAVAILENLQNQFKAGGWEPRKGDGSKWFDLTPEGKKRLYQRMFEPGYSQSTELRVPKKYGMTFRLKCTDGCWPGEKPPYLFLVDVGLSFDTQDWKREDPLVWDKAFAGNAVSAAPARFTCPGGRSR
jgi:hypothetical protein